MWPFMRISREFTPSRQRQSDETSPLELLLRVVDDEDPDCTGAGGAGGAMGATGAIGAGGASGAYATGGGKGAGVAIGVGGGAA